MDHEGRTDPEDKRSDPPSEGVRIIGAEEAAEALERGDVAQRRGGDQPRYGDRPTPPADDGPRPVLRFPLGSSSTLRLPSRDGSSLNGDGVLLLISARTRAASARTPCEPSQRPASSASPRPRSASARSWSEGAVASALAWRITTSRLVARSTTSSPLVPHSCPTRAGVQPSSR